ncbi:MAG: hypothetical protein RLZZ387_1160 [Chloroflexota bacterium]|jgi:SAM-dependent methyltransferase
MTTMAEPTPCPLCGGAEPRPHLCRRGHEIVRCPRCGFMFVSPPPSPAELAAFYRDPAYFQGGEAGYVNYLADQSWLEGLARGRLERIERLLPRRGTVLDVGCAAGFFLSVARERGWRPLGAELSDEMAAYARRLAGCPVAPSVDQLGIAPGTLDAVTLWEYVEHVPQPREEIERLATLLRPGGVLALSTPNTAYWTAIHRPEHWKEFSPPAHLGFFTDATLRRLLESCGLEVVALPHLTPRAPSHPYALERLLGQLRELVGSGASRRTPLWWSFGLAWRAAELASIAGYRLRWPGSDLHLGIEAYARKR